MGDPAGGQCLFCIQPLTFECAGSPLDCSVAPSNHFLSLERQKHPVRVGGEGFQLFVHLHCSPPSNLSSLFFLISALFLFFFLFLLPLLDFFAFPTPQTSTYHPTRDFYITGVMNIKWSGTLKMAFQDEETYTKRGRKREDGGKRGQGGRSRELMLDAF